MSQSYWDLRQMERHEALYILNVSPKKRSNPTVTEQHVAKLYDRGRQWIERNHSDPVVVEDLLLSLTAAMVVVLATNE